MRASAFTGSSVVSTSSRPRPSTMPGGPPGPPVVNASAQHLIAAAEAEHPAAAAQWARMSMSQPSRARSARSASVDLVPGMMTRSASAGTARRAGRIDGDAGLEPQRIEIVEIGDARQAQARRSEAAALVAGRSCSSASASSAGSRRAAAKCGTTPRQGQPVRSSMKRCPSSNSAGSPWKLLTSEPRSAPRRPGRSPRRCRPVRR